MPPPTPRTVDAIYREELDRFARVAVALRASKVYAALIPIAIIAALAPTLPRILVLAGAAGGMIWVSKREPGRLARQGFSVAFVAQNACILAFFHGVIFLVTGGLASPILPVMFAFTFAVSLVLGRDPTFHLYLPVQMAVVMGLAGAHALGWAQQLAPSWLAPGYGTLHTVVTAGTMMGLIYATSRLARHLRAMFDEILGRVAEGRSEILAAHQAQAEELTALSGAIAHELKNPLASVKGLASLLARDIAEGKPAERLSVLRREVDRMQGTLDEFLTFSRPLVPLVETLTDLRAVAEEVATLHEGIAKEQQHRVRVDGAGTARVDVRKTRQILINLVQNALDASPAGGAVVITVRADAPDVEVTVDDAGPGPDPSLADRLFEPGVTTKAQGNGLGLTVARTLARQQGGELVLAARPGGGARAVLRLPAAGVA